MQRLLKISHVESKKKKSLQALKKLVAADVVFESQDESSKHVS